MKDNDFSKFIDELIDKNDILDVVRGYVDLTRKGNSYWGRCPFHHEKTASFHVDERRRIYKCFGCGAGGNVIKFVQEIENVSYMQAVRILADRAGMEVPHFNKVDEKKLADKRKRADKLYDMMAELARFYNKNLMANDGVLTYFKEHNIDKSIITAFGLGYSANLTGAIRHLKSLGYTDEDMESVGVAVRGDKGELRDFFAGRIVFPHINAFGKVAGFAASKRNGETIYSSDSDIFRRAREIYGTHLIKNVKIEEGLNSLILVKTPLDAVTMRGQGIKNVVAVMDDRIEDVKARGLVRFTNKFIIVFDNVENVLDKDYDGLNALTEEGGNVKVASLIEPTSVYKSVERHTFARLQDRIKNAKSLLEYQLRELKKGFDLNDDKGRDGYIDRAKEFIMKLDVRSKQEAYVSVLARLANVSEDYIRKRYFSDGKTVENISSPKNTEITKKRNGKYYSALITLFGIMNAGYRPDEDIKNYVYGKDREYYEALISGEDVSAEDYFDAYESDKIINYNFDGKTVEKVAEDCIRILREEALVREKEELVRAIDNESDADKKRDMLKRLMELMRD